MRITPEEIYALKGLKIGDKVNVKHFKINPHIVTEDCLIDRKGYHRSVSLLINNDFEKVERKIWGIDEIKEGNLYWFVGSNGILYNECYDGFAHEKNIINSIAFKKEKYAEEYKQKLIAFNKEYKKGCE
jgi:hypothetical protein